MSKLCKCGKPVRQGVKHINTINKKGEIKTYEYEHNECTDCLKVHTSNWHKRHRNRHVLNNNIIFY
jgi:hypothetical protein